LIRFAECASIPPNHRIAHVSTASTIIFAARAAGPNSIPIRLNIWPNSSLLLSVVLRVQSGHGSDVAIESAGVTLLKGDLVGIVRARKLSRAVMRNIRQKLVFAFAYNVAGIPIAAGVLYPVTGMMLSPAIAAAAMAMSSVSVISNALRLRAIRL
jgi:hypothetical protein